MNITKSELHELIMECMEETIQESNTAIHTPLGKGFGQEFKTRHRRDKTANGVTRNVSSAVERIRDAVNDINDTMGDEEFLGFTRSETKQLTDAGNLLNELIKELKQSTANVKDNQYNINKITGNQVSNRSRKRG